MAKPIIPHPVLPLAQRPLRALRWTIALFAALLTLCLLVLLSDFAMPSGNPLSWDRAVFTLANAATLTAFPQTLGTGEYLPPARLALFLLTVGGSLFTMIAGSMAVVRILRLRYTDVQVVTAALICHLIAFAIGVAFPSRGQGPFLGPLQAASAFANSGLWLSDASSSLQWRTHVWLLIACTGGLGLPVLMDLFDAVRGRTSLCFHSRTVLSLSAALYLLATALFFLLRWIGVRGMDDSPDSIRLSLAAASAAALDTRTAGLPIEFAQLFPWASMQWLAALLMVIGASPAGTGGGLKTTTVAEVFLGLRRIFAGQRAARSFAIAATWLLGYATIMFVSFLLLLITAPQIPPDRALFLSISATSNVGLAHTAVSLTGPPLFVLAAAMGVGRLAPLAVLWWMAQTTQDAELAIG